MICPVCHSDTRVIRTVKYSTVIKRERVCINESCHQRFDTSETIDENNVEMVETGIAH